MVRCSVSLADPGLSPVAIPVQPEQYWWRIQGELLPRATLCSAGAGVFILPSSSDYTLTFHPPTPFLSPSNNPNVVVAQGECTYYLCLFVCSIQNPSALLPCLKRCYIKRFLTVVCYNWAARRLCLVNHNGIWTWSLCPVGTKGCCVETNLALVEATLACWWLRAVVALPYPAVALRMHMTRMSRKPQRSVWASI